MFHISHWWLILLIHECCFTQSMTDCLRPACTHLLPLFLTLYTFFLRFTHFFLKYTLPHSQWDPKRGKHCSLFHLKIFLTRYSWMRVCVLVAQSCLTLCDPMDCSLSRSSIHEIFQARGLEWVAISFSRGSSWPRDRTWVSHIVGRRFTLWATREVLCLFA